ncbi:hypothetical protein KEC49_02220 ['Elaeagnus angustifolia' witches'-broom phytoplasma]|uniref:Uncharacterized protein n=1 Tax='Elaeagnus angustifolia' witches'-broom phytoplasma TaxID=1538355 RepID=A0ABS5V9G3_9MOLU|nr:hypothetical protein ['Elaeagnus angustifolia' witches'-broom phytoplasma]MCX2955850.1 hypothetical protein [Candidatus Phytoplasma australiense]
MRIIPYELYPYTSDLALCALRKEFGMYDYCLNTCKNNKAMQPLLDMKRNYFYLSFDLWVLEMQQRKHYINSFHLFYANKHKYCLINTDFILILECCIQWEIKGFMPYNTSLSWFLVALKCLEQQQEAKSQTTPHPNFVPTPSTNYYLDFCIYQKLLLWYKQTFMQANEKGNLKPKQLNMEEVKSYFQTQLKRI